MRHEHGAIRLLPDGGLVSPGVDDRLSIARVVGHVPVRVLTLFLLLVSPSTWAAYASLNMPTGVIRNAADLIMTGAANPHFQAGAVSANASLTHAGKQIVVPASWRLASNAGRYAVSAWRLNPWLLGAGALAWAAERYMHPIGGADSGVMLYSNTTPSCPITAGTCGGHNGWVTYSIPIPEQGMCQYMAAAGWTYCVEGESQTTIERNPALEQDYNDLGNHPLTDVAADDFANHSGVPVVPTMEPVTVPLSDPYLKPDGSTAQEKVRVTPSPTVEDPLRVRIDTYEEPVTNPDGTPFIDPELATEPTATEEEKPDLCEKYPESSGCLPLGTEDGTRPTIIPGSLTFTPDNLAVPKGCPADRTFQAAGRSFTLAMAPVCDAADTYVHPLIMLMAAVSAYMIFVGGLRT